MILRNLYRISLILIFFISLVAQAAGDDFKVRTLVGDDLTPPSVPTGLTATPVATTQIDLLWASSTDDYLLSGYQVFRDGSQIATTTVPNYSDVGLTPDTLYTYYVTAFDSFYNYSASSTEAATTTLASSTPPGPEPTGPQGVSYGTLLKVKLVRLEVIPQQDSVLIRYQTEGHARSIIRWGETVSYELGSLRERSFSKMHETRITGLQPGTTYKFIIEGENKYGIAGVLTESLFTTLPLKDTFPPANVQDLRATVSDGDVVLAWRNPEDPDLEKIRVVESDRFYPSDPVDGWVVYEGKGETAYDRGAATPGTRRYYTVFTYDQNGNVSSGAVVAVRITDGGATIETTPSETINPVALTFEDLEFFQNGKKINVRGDRVMIDGTQQLTIALPYSIVPEHLKTILVTLEDSTDPHKEFSFLLRINDEKTSYVSLLAPFGVSGEFPLRISVFDYTTSQIGYAKGVVVSEITSAQSHEEVGEGLAGGLVHDIFALLNGYMLLFILLLILLAYGAWRLLQIEW